MDNTLLIIAKVFPQSKINSLKKISLLRGNEISLIIRTTAAPDKNKANKAVIKLISQWLGIKQSAIELLRGSTCRNKIFRVNDIDIDIITKIQITI